MPCGGGSHKKKCDDDRDDGIRRMNKQHVVVGSGADEDDHGERLPSRSSK